MNEIFTRVSIRKFESAAGQIRREPHSLYQVNIYQPTEKIGFFVRR